MARDPGFAGFTVEGVLDGRTVVARGAPGRVEGDDVLLERARALVVGREPIEAFAGRSILPSLDGDVVAVALTVIHACDAVAQVALRR